MWHEQLKSLIEQAGGAAAALGTTRGAVAAARDAFLALHREAVIYSAVGAWDPPGAVLAGAFLAHAALKGWEGGCFTAGILPRQGVIPRDRGCVLLGADDDRPDAILSAEAAVLAAGGKVSAVLVLACKYQSTRTLFRRRGRLFIQLLDLVSHVRHTIESGESPTRDARDLPAG